MQIHTHAGHWQFAAARFPDAVQFGFEAAYVSDADDSWIYSYEKMVVEVVHVAHSVGASAAILVHGNPTLPARSVSLRTIIRDVMRDDDVAARLCIKECIECDEAFIVIFGPRPPHHRRAAH